MKILNTSFLLISLLLFSCKKDKVSLPAVNLPPDNPNNVLDTLGKIQVNLSGMHNANGKINFALYNSGSSFNDPTQVYKSLILTPSVSTMSFTLDSIPAGTYAFGVFHDENDNQQIDQNWLGIPTEGFAFSNNAMGSFGPPNYDQAKFVVLKSQTHVQTIALHFY